MKHYFNVAGLILLLFVAACVQAAPSDRYEELTGEGEEFDIKEKEWVESQFEVPELPADSAWSVVAMDSVPSNMKLSLDKDNIVIDERDWVVRYWLLLRSSAGGYNASYQGLRCRTREYVNYAYGQQRREPKVTKVKNLRWSPIGKKGRGNYVQELAEYVFCSGEVPRNLRKIHQVMDGNFELMNPYDDFLEDR